MSAMQRLDHLIFSSYLFLTETSWPSVISLHSYLLRLLDGKMRSCRFVSDIIANILRLFTLLWQIQYLIYSAFSICYLVWIGLDYLATLRMRTRPMRREFREANGNENGRELARPCQSSLISYMTTLALCRSVRRNYRRKGSLHTWMLLFEVHYSDDVSAHTFL